jgi:hypothetical protein
MHTVKFTTGEVFHADQISASGDMPGGIVMEGRWFPDADTQTLLVSPLGWTYIATDLVPTTEDQDGDPLSD